MNITVSNDRDGVIHKGDNIADATEAIISNFEQKVKISILTKTLAAAQDGKPPRFTDEEMAYLTKQAIQESPLAEMTVAVPCPSITLKKGKTELNIKNAAAILQKMEEKYPTLKPAPLPQSPAGGLFDLESKENYGAGDESEDLTSNDLDEIINELESEIAQEEHQEKLLKKHPRSPGTDGPHNVVGTEEEIKTMQDQFKKRVNFPVSKVSPEVVRAVAPDADSFHPAPPQEIVKTVNRNAYEIRSDILKESIGVVLSKESTINDNLDLTVENILKVASKLYGFVEDKSRRSNFK
jgi:hypothetical protein